MNEFDIFSMFVLALVIIHAAVTALHEIAHFLDRLARIQGGVLRRIATQLLLLPVLVIVVAACLAVPVYYGLELMKKQYDLKQPFDRTDNAHVAAF